jgi:hypothetical protein
MLRPLQRAIQALLAETPEMNLERRKALQEVLDMIEGIFTFRMKE